MLTVDKETTIFAITDMTNTNLLSTLIHLSTVRKVNTILQVIAVRMVGMPQSWVLDFQLLIYPSTFLRFQLK
ncbi:hypothetical protein D3C81_1029610 [compost metagenome]